MAVQHRRIERKRSVKAAAANRRLILGGLAAGSTAAALLLGGVLTDGSAQETGTVPVASGIAASGTALIPQLQQEVRGNPTDVVGLGLLGLAYQQRARETGDPSYYTKSEGVLRRALRYSPDDLVATGGLGALALSRHRFREALVLGRRAVTLSPSTARGYGVVGDALVELGRYREAFAAFNRMASLKPSLSSYARVSYARELLGDAGGAAKAMRLAIDAATGQPEALAWSQTQLGKLSWSQGRVAAAEREYRAALTTRPGYVYAFDGLAQVEAARGRTRNAIGYELRAVDAIPLPQFVASKFVLLPFRRTNIAIPEWFIKNQLREFTRAQPWERTLIGEPPKGEPTVSLNAMPAELCSIERRAGHRLNRIAKDRADSS